MDLIDLSPPQNIEAEEALLGAVLLEGPLLKQLTLTSDDFYKPMHQEIYRVMVSLDADGIPIDFVSVASRLNSDHKAGLIAISQNAFTTANFQYHSDLIREASIKRKIRQTCQGIVQEINLRTVDEAMTELQKLSSIITTGRGGKLIDMMSVTRDLIETIDRRYKSRHSMSGIPSGLADLDDLTDGFQDGDLVVLAGRPGMGKSALAMSFAQNAARQDVSVGVISLEMGPQQLGMRGIASLAGIELWRLRKGIMSREDYDEITATAGIMAGLPIYFSFFARTSREIERVVTQMVAKGCKLIILDYVQLAKGSDQRLREREVAEVSLCLKTAAQMHSIPVIAIAQLNRGVEQRENKRPILADLRDSGQIEQDADIVMFLYPSNIPGTIKLWIAKGRNIGCGEITLSWDGDKMIFGNYQEAVESPGLKKEARLRP